MKKTFFAVGVMTVIVSMLVSCSKGLSKKDMALVEEFVKMELAYNALLNDCYENSYNQLEDVLKSGKITSNGFEGYGSTPEEIIGAMETNVSNYEASYELLSTETYEDIEDLQTKITNDGTIESIYLDKILKKAKEFSVVFSEFIPVKTAGSSKMWTFTEINSGIEFSVTKKDDIIEVGSTDKGQSKMDNVLKEQKDNVYDLYDDYQESVKQKNAEENYLWRALFGLS